jgi:hypothetical protein
MKKTIRILLSAILLFTLFACDGNCDAPKADGEKLVRQLWTDFNKTDEALFNHWLSDAFQSVHEDKARDKADEVKVLMNLHLDGYTLANFASTQDENVLVVTYTVAVHETINGKVLPKAPAERLSVFMYDDGDWKWIAHANLNPMTINSKIQ